MYETYRKGQIAELKVALRATEKGYTVSKPMIESRYDLVIDNGRKLYRVQVKYLNALSKDGNALELDLRKETRNNGKKKTYSSDEIDVIAVYVPYVDCIMWLGPSIFDRKQSLTFRLKPTKRNVNGSKFVSDFIW